MPMTTWKKTSIGFETRDIPNFGNGGTVIIPGIGYVPIRKFADKRGSDGRVLYWEYKHVGPGVHTTTYVIWNGWNKAT